MTELEELWHWLFDKANDSDPYDSQMFMKAVSVVGERLSPEPCCLHGQIVETGCPYCDRALGRAGQPPPVAPDWCPTCQQPYDQCRCNGVAR